MSDGERYVAFVPVTGTVRVRDTRTGRSRDLKAPCHAVGASAADVLLVGASAAHVLLACVTGDRVTRDAVLDARTLAVRKLPLLRGLGYVAIGRYWTSTVCEQLCPSFPAGGGIRVATTYVNWRTGRIKTVYGARDLDSPRLLPPPPTPPGFSLYVRDRGSVIFEGADAGLAPLEARDSSGRVTRLSSCRPDCELIDASAGKVTWAQYPTDAGVYYGYDVATHRRYRWPTRVPAGVQGTVADLDDVVHTRYEALVSILQTDYGSESLARYGVVAYPWNRP